MGLTVYSSDSKNGFSFTYILVINSIKVWSLRLAHPAETHESTWLNWRIRLLGHFLIHTVRELKAHSHATKH
jgi:hypothetical protein